MADIDDAKNKVRNKAEEMQGRAKQAGAALTGDDAARREGRVEEAKGDLKQAGEKVKDSLHRR